MEKNENLNPCFQFYPEPVNNFSEENNLNKVFIEASIFDVFMVELFLGVDPTQSYGENTALPTPTDRQSRLFAYIGRARESLLIIRSCVYIFYLFTCNSSV